MLQFQQVPAVYDLLIYKRQATSRDVPFFLDVFA
jgi:hypothetical protein